MVKNKKVNNSFSNDSSKGWDKNWETIFQIHDWGNYPPEELVRFIARIFPNNIRRKKIQILDLGCGTGSSSWYLAREGLSVFGVDGSKTGIRKTTQRLKNENLKGVFKVMDYTKLNFPDNSFDCIIDICSIQHNSLDNVPLILNQVNKVLKPQGIFFSMLVSDGTFLEPYQNKGYIHFYKLQEIKKLFKTFNIISIEKSERTENNRKDKIIHWIVVCNKRQH